VYEIVTFLNSATVGAVYTAGYDAFGNKVVDGGSGGDRFLYTGREWDGPIGQYYYRARYYSPTIGRFGSEDPLGFSGGDANLYRYVDNSPTNAVDPSGFQGQPVTFPNQRAGDQPGEQDRWNKDPSVRKKVIPVNRKSDLTDAVKPGQPCKFVVTAKGTLVVITDERTPHSMGPAAVGGGKVGDPIQSGGHLILGPGDVVCYDVITNHYKVHQSPNKQAGIDQGAAGIKGVGLKPSYTPDVKKPKPDPDPLRRYPLAGPDRFWDRLGPDGMTVGGRVIHAMP
jgi:RHS repeat-associated protein